MAGTTDEAPVPPVGVVGAGTMGSGIALVAARAGHPVRLLDARPGAADAAVGTLVARMTRLAAKDIVTQDDVQAVRARLVAVEALEDLAGCGLVIEAIAENLTAKRELFAALEGLLAEDAVLATNTSSLSVTAVAAGLARPGRVVGMHFFNPADRMELVEVVRGEQTGADVLAEAVRLARAWGKTPVSCSSTPGFVVNRVARPYYGEAQRLLEALVADAATIDAVLREAGGFRLGPFELTDLVGQDVNLAVSRSVWDQTFHDPRYAPTVLQQRLVDAGRFGRKTGRGVYAYDPADPATPLDPATGGPVRPADSGAGSSAPARVEYLGGWFVLRDLLRLTGAQIVEPERPTDPGPEAIGVRLPSGGLLVETPTESGLPEGVDAVVADWVLDPATATRVCLAPLPGASHETLDEAVALVRSAGVAVSVVHPVAGLVVARTVAMLVNEAADLVLRAEATADDVDIAMRLGTGYPLGPMAWGDRIGAARVLAVLRALGEAEPGGRYRPSRLLVEAAVTGTPLTAVASEHAHHHGPDHREEARPQV